MPNCRSSGVPKDIYCSASAPLPAISPELTICTALPDTPSTNSGVPITVPLFPFPELSSAFALSKDAYSTGAGSPVCPSAPSAWTSAGSIPIPRTAASVPPSICFHTFFIAGIHSCFLDLSAGREEGSPAIWQKDYSG